MKHLERLYLVTFQWSWTSQWAGALTSSMYAGSCSGSIVSTWMSSLNCTVFFSVFTADFQVSKCGNKKKHNSSNQKHVYLISYLRINRQSSCVLLPCLSSEVIFHKLRNKECTHAEWVNKHGIKHLPERHTNEYDKQHKKKKIVAVRKKHDKLSTAAKQRSYTVKAMCAGWRAIHFRGFWQFNNFSFYADWQSFF